MAHAHARFAAAALRDIACIVVVVVVVVATLGGVV
jgi:hypothetical protein